MTTLSTRFSLRFFSVAKNRTKAEPFREEAETPKLCNCDMSIPGPMKRTRTCSCSFADAIEMEGGREYAPGSSFDTAASRL